MPMNTQVSVRANAWHAALLNWGSNVLARGRRGVAVATAEAARHIRGSVHKAGLWCTQTRTHKIHGIRLRTAVTFDGEISSSHIDQLDRAFNLIQRCSPSIYRRLRIDLDWILVGDVECGAGEFVDSIKACVLDVSNFREDRENGLTAVQQLASYVVHEATHARLFAMGIRNYERFRYRHERLCRRMQQRFLENAKFDFEDPVPHCVDTKYHGRFGVMQEWFYGDDVTDTQPNTNHRDQADSLAESDSFHSNVWSSRSRYSRYAQELLSYVEDDPMDAWVWKSTGYQLARIRRYDDAICHTTRATELRDGFDSAWEWRASAAYLNDQMDLAYESFQLAYQRNPGDLLVLRWLSSLAVGLDRSNAAMEYAAELVSLCPTPKSFRFMAVAHLINEEHDLALQNINKAITGDSDCELARLVAAKINRELGNHSDASRHWCRYLLGRENERDAFVSPIKLVSVVLERRVRSDFVELRCLCSSRRPPLSENELRTLASELRKATEELPATIEEDYLYSMVRRKRLTHEPSFFALPISIAQVQGCYIFDVDVPRRCFGVDIPNALDALTVWTDRNNPVAIIPDVAIQSSTRQQTK